MFSVFKSFKQKMLSENKLGRYLKYALGEIILVVIGILLAIRIDAYFDNINRGKLQVKILEEIYQNLQGDLLDLQDESESFDLVRKTDSLLLAYISSGNAYNDTIGSLIHISQMSPHLSYARSGYKLLESRGIELIRQDSLRVKLTELYERSSIL